MIRKEKTEQIASVLNQFINKYKIGEKLKEIELINSWDKVVGKTIAKYTKEININKRTLYIKTDSAIARTELHRIKDFIVKSVNDFLKIKLIDEVKII